MGIAAIAAGKLPVPFRTRQISPSAFLTVLSCESTWELWIAAMLTTLFFKKKSVDGRENREITVKRVLSDFRYEKKQIAYL